MTIDAWCKNCQPQWGRRAKSVGRQYHRAEAKRMADLAVAANIKTRYDEYTRKEGKPITKMAWFKELCDARKCIDMTDGTQRLSKMLLQPVALEELQAKALFMEPLWLT